MEVAPGKKAVAELDKFKRRLIRAVARLLLDEKRPEDQIWQELKKETGCDCELLWTRMRSVTVKKLDRLLAAGDCMDAVPKAARMTLTDWLLFDLVLVHQKIDLIGEENPSKDNEDPAVLVELFELVKKFRLEYRRGDDLAETWSTATLYYNKNGHHCSPMLLQRRWYQLKVIVRVKFYEFWYAYRGNSARVQYAQPYRPTPLQTEIARTFKLVILQPFRDWEDLIKDRLVILPAEFERKMKERSARRRSISKPREDVPDLVMIEPRIETIDLRIESDDNEEERKEEEDDDPPPPLVTIKQEPQDEEDMDIEETQIQPPKKSMYEVVLESTHLENEKLDSLYTKSYQGDLEDDETEMEEQEEAIESTMGDEEESMLPQITSVFGNVSDTSVLANIDETRVYRTVESSEISGHSDDENVCNADNANDNSNDRHTGLSSTVDDTIELDNSDDCDDLEENARNSEKDTGAGNNIDENCTHGTGKDTDCDNLVENSARGNNKDTGVCTYDKETDICANVEDVSANVENVSVNVKNVSANVENVENVCTEVENVAGNVENVSTNVENVSANVKNVSANVENVSTNVEEVSGNVREASAHDDIDEISDDDDISGTLDETSVIGNSDKTCVGNVATSEVVTENVPNILNILNAKTTNIDNNTVTYENGVAKEAENISHSIVITDSDDDDQNFVHDLIICNRSQPKGTMVTEDLIKPKNTIEQMEVDTIPHVVKISSIEPFKVSADNKVAAVAEKVKGDIQSNVGSFTFGQFSSNISFADVGIEFADDGILYVDEDQHNETKVENNIRHEEEADDVPKIDAKLLMCPIIYTTRLDDMNLFHKQPFDHINDKRLLNTIALKSKPILNDTYNDNSKTIEYVQENVSSKPIENISVDGRSNVIMNEPINDNSIRMIQEPLNNKIEYVSRDNISFEKQMPENVVSDDDDYDENVIDESQKVKPTSYLLQKPRSRKYNPIQLCKNPDFNTRLKRLNVGFFSSPRNRVLIKSCKPLTIDLSKAFESKLISGTLYLKPSDQNVVQEIIDDTRSQNVSVIPSAMPAQSLINNSKVADILPILRRCLETSKPPEDLGTTIERNKVINLPDITEIRRINQRLLTAEVTPIQVQNNQPQVPVTIVTSMNTPTSPKTITISETVEDMQAEATDIRGPPKLLDITDDSPTKTSTEHYSSTERNTSAAVRPKSKAITGRPPKMFNGKRLFPPKPVVWKPKQIRPQIPWLTKNNDASINSRKLEETLLTLDSLNKMIFLLTDKLEPDAIQKKSKLKGKKHKNSAPQPKQQRKKVKSIDECICDPEPSKEAEIAVEELIKCPKINIKSAINYPPTSQVYTVSIQDKNKSVLTNDDADTEHSKNKIQYCCWARQRMLQLLFRRESIPGHDCPRICGCCCRNLLKDYIMHDQKIKKTELRIIKGTVEYTSSLEKANMINAGTFSYKTVVKNPVETAVKNPVETVVKNPVETVVKNPVEAIVKNPVETVVKNPVETVVKNPVETVVKNPVDAVVKNPVETVVENPVETVVKNPVGTVVKNPVETHVEAPGQVPVIETVQVPGELSILVPDETADTESITCTENEPIDLDAMDTDCNVPVLGGEVSVKTTGVVLPLAARRLETPVNVFPGHSISSVPRVQQPNTIPCHCVTPQNVPKSYQYTHSITTDNLTGGLVLNSVTKTSTTPISPPSIIKVLEAKKAKAMKRSRIKMLPPPRFIKPYQTPKSPQEKILFLNSKQFTEKPPEIPVLLGKNKILLTTVKFPPNLKLFKQAKDALKASLKIPKGVHLICLPNGKISYHIDNNVVVKATDLTEMPAIIAAVRAHMSIHAEQEEPLIKKNLFPTFVVTENEVVNLVDDDDESGSYVNENENNKTPLANEVQTTEENVTIHSGDSTNDNCNTQIESPKETEENRLESNINGNLIAKETENTQNESTNQNTDTNIDIQENVQEPNQHDIPSASTEQVQDHPALTPPNQNVSAEVDDLPKPSSHTENTDTQEVLAEQIQDPSDPLSQKVSDKVDDLPKPSSHTESTDTQEVLAEQLQDPSDPSSQNVSIEVQNHPEQTTQNVSTVVPEASSSEPSRNKTKNILSDLMEMSGIFDEDMTPAIEETVSAQPGEAVTLTQPILMTPVLGGTVSAQRAEMVKLTHPMLVRALSSPPPALAPITAIPVRPIIMPALFNSEYPPSKVKSNIGELTPITSLYELKYACANKGIFFKLDFESGLITPINVCMKPSSKKQAPLELAIFPKSVIDLTDDDGKSEQNNTEPDISPGKRSLLLINNVTSGSTSKAVQEFSGPVKPVKLFKALKPSILQRLNMHKIKLDSKKPTYDKSSPDHKIKRKQFLRKINLNADSTNAERTNADSNFIKVNYIPNYKKKIKVNRDLINLYKEPAPTTSRTEPNKELEITILSDDDCDDSDDEPLAKVAKRKRENLNAEAEQNANAPKNGVNAPGKDAKAPELVTKDIELQLVAEEDVIEPEAPIGKQIESELPVTDPENDKMSDDDNDIIELDAPSDFEVIGESNDDDEVCILGF